MAFLFREEKMKKLHVRDIILIALIAIIFGFIYLVSDGLYNVLTALLTPVGYGMLANDIMMGIWSFSGILSSTTWGCISRRTF